MPPPTSPPDPPPPSASPRVGADRAPRDPARRPTLLDVARAAGVSRSTASYAYNQPERLSAELRERVRAAAVALGYAGPDPAAAALRRGRAGALGVLFSESLSYAFADPAAILFLQGVATVGERLDVALTLLAVTPGGGTGGPAAIRTSVVDGVIVYSVPEAHPAVLALAARGLPLAYVDMPAPEGEPQVRIDDRGGARRTAEHVLGLGHRRVGVLADRLSADGFRGTAGAARRRDADFPVARNRLAGYADALRDAGIDPDGVPVYDCGGNAPEDGRVAASVLLGASPAPTALLCMTDQIARGALLAAADAGLAVPGDLSVTGFDDLPEAAAADPPLTSVHQDHEAKGVRAAQLLLEPGREPGPRSRAVELPVRLIVRGSTGPAPHARR
jgi:DNA-binding LacI/PurR family transcriptional regulator